MARVEVEADMHDFELSTAGYSSSCERVAEKEPERMDILYAVSVCLALSLGLWTAILLPFLL